MSRELNSRERKKLAQKAAEGKNKKISNLFFIGFFLTLLLITYPYIEYHRTIIDYKIPLSVFIFSGTLFGWLIKNRFERGLKEIKVNAQLFWFIISSGSIFTSLFFLMNNIFSDTDIYYIKTPIIDVYVTSSRSGRKSIGVDVELLKRSKTLHFPLEDGKMIDSSNAILVGLNKGGLGFEIIRNKTLIK